MNTADPGQEMVEGGCACRALRYSVTLPPLFVHCCHCRWCQRETGSAFAINALIEAGRVSIIQGKVEKIPTPSESGEGQKISRCPVCHVAVWSNYAGLEDAVRFVRVGTLDDPDRLPPDIHIYTASKQPWVIIPPDAARAHEYYDREAVWPADSLARLHRVRGG